MAVENKIKTNTSFWEEINKYDIVVPCYQRDYAQGRTGNSRIDNIRMTFVGDLYKAINKAINERQECHSGLVFGSYDENEKKFIAVDGQQRLTTIFLLHWYVAWREDRLSDYKEVLKKFKWNTRSYSSQFVDLLYRVSYTEGDVGKIIKEHEDYFSIWECDPTVKSMHVMLEEIGSQYPKDCGELCSILFSSQSGIKYDIIHLDKGTDGKTYVKMNSRGRQLTTFENFKAKFIDKYNPEFRNDFDSKWMDFMLKFSVKVKENIDPNPDVYFMNYINEHTFVYSRLASRLAGKFFPIKKSKVKDDDVDNPFISFDEYDKVYRNEEVRKLFKKNTDWLVDNYKTIEDNDDRFADDKKFFIDELIKSTKPEYSHRARFFAVLKYGQLTSYQAINVDEYKEWIRVFRNLIKNTTIDDESFGDICEAIDKIDNSNIYQYLIDNGELPKFNTEQVKEERIKAKKIVELQWKDIIIAAEKYSFFNGSIRFLYRNSNGKVTDDWSNFHTKLANAKKYFKEDAQNNDKPAVRDEFDNANLLKALFSRFTADNYTSVLDYHPTTFNNYGSSWRYYLLRNDICSPVHDILMGETDIKDVIPNPDNQLKYIYQLSNTMLLDFVIKNIPTSHIRWYHNHYAIYPSGPGVFLNAGKRDKMLLHTEGIKVVPSAIVDRTDFLFGSDINFTFEDSHYQWYRDNTIYLMDKKFNYIEKDSLSKKEEEKYYCFRNAASLSENDFKENLLRLAEEYKKDAEPNASTTTD